MAAEYSGAENRGLVSVEIEHAIVGMLRGKCIYLARCQGPTGSCMTVVHPCHHHMSHHVLESIRVSTQTSVKDNVVRQPA